MTTHLMITRRAQATAEAYCDLEEALESIEPLQTALEQSKKELLEVLNNDDVIKGDLNLDAYKGKDSAFKFPDQGLNIVITPRYAFIPHEEDAQLTEATERVKRAELALKRAKLNLKSRQDLLIASDKATRTVLTHRVALVDIPKTTTPEFN